MKKKFGFKRFEGYCLKLHGQWFIGVSNYVGEKLGDKKIYSFILDS